MSKFIVIRDTREKLGWEWKATEFCEGMVTAKLDTGDYSIQGLEDVLCIERKRSVSEFAKNITEARFDRELERMSIFKYAFLVCEFDMHDIDIYPHGAGIPKRMLKKIKVRRNFILSKVADIQIKYDIPIIFCGSDIDIAKQITMNIMKRVWKIYA